MSATGSNQPASSIHACRNGLAVVMHSSPLIKAVLFGLLLLSALMLPFGRSGPNDAGGFLAPLCVDSGYLYRPQFGGGMPATDFFSIYDAGARLLAGMDPYGVNLSNGVGHRAPFVATYRYPPITTFWLAVPFNVLPPWTAWVAWVLGCFAMQLVTFLLCCGRRPDGVLAFAVIWLAWFPTIAEWHMGQFTQFMAVLMVWSFDAMQHGGRFAGLGWMLAAWIKVYPLAMAPSLWLWGRRRLAIVAVLALVLTTVGWKVLVTSAIEEGMIRQGIAGRLIGGERVPYAGAQGPQEMVNAIVWKLRGRAFGDKLEEASATLHDPVFWINGVILGSFGLLCLWGLIRTREGFSAEAIGLFWMAWFYSYMDCWEHHYLLMQGLLAFLLMRGTISGRMALLLWCFAGAPSLWWLWQRTGYTGNNLTELIGLLYFIQRPIAVLGLSWFLARRIARNTA